MKDLTMMRDFNYISKQFRDNNFNLQTVSDILVKIREYKKLLSENEAIILFNIVINVLENDVEVINEDEWCKKNAYYFSGNVVNFDSEYFNQLRQNFEIGEFNLNTILDLAKVIKNEFKELSLDVEFLIRNIEVTLRDDVRLKEYSNFMDSGNIFADLIDKAINM